MAKLNMKHGFVRYITKNQVDRDNYDREVRTKPKPPRTLSANKCRRPAQAIYTPPSRVGSSPSCDNSESSSPEKDEVSIQHSNVNVCFTDEQGQTHSFIINKSDDPVEVAAQFCADMNYSEMYIQPLADRIVQECSVYFIKDS